MMDFLKVFRPLIADFFSTIIFIVALEITDNVVLSTAVGIAAGVLDVPIPFYRFPSQRCAAVLELPGSLSNPMKVIIEFQSARNCSRLRILRCHPASRPLNRATSPRTALFAAGRS